MTPDDALTCPLETAEAIDALNALAKSLVRTDTVRARHLFERTAAAAKQLGSERGEAESLQYLGRCFLFLSDYHGAIRHLTAARFILERTEDRLQAALVISDLGEAYSDLGEYAVARTHYTEALTIQRSIADRKGEAISLGNLGHLAHLAGNYAEALTYFSESRAIHEALGDTIRLARTLGDIGKALERLDDYEPALASHLQSLELARSLGDRRTEASALNNIGNLYVKLDLYDRALETYQESLVIKHELGDKRTIANSLGNIALVHLKLYDYDRALAGFEQCLAIKEEIGDREGIATALLNIGNVHSACGRNAEAREVFERSLALYRNLGDRLGITDIVFQHGRLYENEGQFDLAIDAFRTAMQMAQQHGLKRTVIDAVDHLIKVYKQQGNTEAALRCYEQLRELEHARFNEESDRRTRNMLVKFETERAKEDAERRKVEAELYRLKTVELADALRAAEAANHQARAAQQEAQAAQQEAQAAQQEAQAANQLKSELLAIAAHDLKSPLQTVIGFAALSMELVSGGSDLMKYQQFICTASERMLSLIDTLLGDAALESGKLPLHLAPVDVAELLKSVALQHRVRAAGKSQTIDLTVPESCVIVADRDRLTEILDNLLSNAMKYSPSGGKISIGCRRIAHDAPAAERLQLRVEDEGQGLSADDMTKLFGKFQRLSARPTGGESSTGLGLSIVKQLVDLHGGKVWAESAGKGKGATFFVELPASPQIFPNS